MGEKSARRSFVRRNHPDVGGDTDEFREGLKKYDVKAPPSLEQPIVPAAPPAAPVSPVSASPASARTARASAAAPRPAAGPPPAPQPPAPKPPATDRLARGLGRFAARVAAKPAEAREAYREGRDTDTPI